MGIDEGPAQNSAFRSEREKEGAGGGAIVVLWEECHEKRGKLSAGTRKSKDLQGTEITYRSLCWLVDEKNRSILEWGRRDHLLYPAGLYFNIGRTVLPQYV